MRLDDQAWVTLHQQLTALGYQADQIRLMETILAQSQATDTRLLLSKYARYPQFVSTLEQLLQLGHTHFERTQVFFSDYGRDDTVGFFSRRPARAHRRLSHITLRVRERQGHTEDQDSLELRLLFHFPGDGLRDKTLRFPKVPPR